jgi:hypothetical protein
MRDRCFAALFFLGELRTRTIYELGGPGGLCLGESDEAILHDIQRQEKVSFFLFFRFFRFYLLSLLAIIHGWFGTGLVGYIVLDDLGRRIPQGCLRSNPSPR